MHTKPNIKPFEKQVQEIIEGENANIVCEGTGKPAPKFTWVKSLKKEDLGKVDRFTVNEDTGVLTITNVQRDDDGQYECTASNAAGRTTANTTVKVIVKPLITEFFNKTVTVEDKVTLECKASGRPLPVITFRKHTSKTPYVMGIQPEDDRIVLTNRNDNTKDDTVIGELIIDRTAR